MRNPKNIIQMLEVVSIKCTTLLDSIHTDAIQDWADDDARDLIAVLFSTLRSLTDFETASLALNVHEPYPRHAQHELL